MEAGRRRGCGLAVRREEDVLGEGHVTCEVPGDRRSACGGKGRLFVQRAGRGNHCGERGNYHSGQRTAAARKPELRATEALVSLLVLIAGARLCPSKDAVSNILFLTSSEFLLSIFIFSWRILASLCCVGFCRRTT